MRGEEHLKKKKGLELVTVIFISQILSCESALFGLVGLLVLFY